MCSMHRQCTSREILDQHNIPYTVLRDSTNEEISGVRTCEALGAAPDRVFKSVLFISHGRHRHRSVLLIPANRKLDQDKAETAVGSSGRAASERETLRDTGFSKGFFGPLCSPAFQVYVDNSANKWDRIIVNAGGRGQYLELSPDDLLSVCDGKYRDLAGPPSVEQYGRNRTLPLFTVLKGFRITGVSSVRSLEIMYRGEELSTGRIVDICELFPRRRGYQAARASDGVTVRMLKYDNDMSRSLRADPIERETLLTLRNRALTYGKTMSQLRFPGSPAILDLFEANQTVYAVAEHLEGELLSDRIEKQGPLSRETVSSLLCPLLAQIEALGDHKDRLRNIRPDTVLLREKDAVLLTFCMPTDIISGQGGMRFFDNYLLDPYIRKDRNDDCASVFRALIDYAFPVSDQ